MSDLSNQKQTFFFVPNWDKSNAADTNGSPMSYVVLGSAKSHDYLTTARARGDDLLASAGLSSDTSSAFFIDDSRGRACSACTATSTSYSKEIHASETHDSSECLSAEPLLLATAYYRSDENGLFDASRTCADLTSELLGSPSIDARGGVRDHTDGNRITTVRGDRVDVVVGNYKRVVFGRVSGAHVGETSYEASGGHVVERTGADVLQTYAIEHVEETGIDGLARWKVVLRADNADVVSRYSGKIAEFHNGPIRKSTIGIDADSPAKNPEITRTLRFGDAFTTYDASDGFERSLTVDKLSRVTDGSSADATDDVSCVSYLRSRGKTSQREFTFKEELRAHVVAETDFYLGRALVSSGGAQLERIGGHYRLATGIRIDAHAGLALRMQYGSRTRAYIGAPWIRGTIAASLTVDVGILTELSVTTLHAAPIKGEMSIGNLNLSYTKAQANIGEQKALALLMEL